ncbi:MAG: cob(I)yrinic acid a,c-diamide adenosyltransferase [Bacteroidales bacterium]|nr:cob(I)yrinic acid a,c-diamide adenosyltransferase [Bacteroidales bacterium]MBN2818752.1 cob(I)yrinic acid a,c-diamide adenosyltransferase [Bacteroidales bacterium]
MKIYTKTGDFGTTALIGGKRVPKNHIRIEAYGTADELISNLAHLRDHDIKEEHKKTLFEILEDLMVVSSILASDCIDCYDNLPKLSEIRIVQIEAEIDRLSAALPELKYFVIPGGHVASSLCHVARTICRRTERIVLSLHEVDAVPKHIMVYINRLSDYLFVLARAILYDFQIDEIKWKPGLDK